MPQTNEPGDAAVLIDGLDAFGLSALEPAAAQAVRAALRTQSRTPAANAEISIAFLDDAAIAGLNEEWLGREGPTDVLSFGLGEAPLVADIYISVDTARRNAQQYGVTLREELMRLVIHGVLHAAGYDHPDGEERTGSEMFRLQERLLARLLEGLPET